MFKFKPLKGYRSEQENVSKFSIQIPETYSEKEIKTKLNLDNKSYMHIISTTFDKSPSLEDRLKSVREKFEQYVRESVIIQDSESIYIYKQIKGDKSFIGFLGLVDVESFKDGSIKIPEETIDTKKKKHVDFINNALIQSNPVLLICESSSKLYIMSDIDMKSKPILSFIDEKGVCHKLWKVDNRLKISQYKEALDNLNDIYLVDGHHRMESIVDYSDKKINDSKVESFYSQHSRNIMTMVAPNDSVEIFEFNRLIKNIDVDKNTLFEKLSQRFTINEKGEKPYFPSHRHHISMYYGGKFYGLYIKHEFRNSPKGLGNIDTYHFNKYILDFIFGIKTKNDIYQNVKFIKGTRDIEGINQMKTLADSQKYEIAFGFYPPSFSELRVVSELGLKIPAKTIYVEPKFLSGLIIFDMK